MHALLIPIVGLITAFGTIGLWIRFITRPRKALASGDAARQLPAPQTILAATEFEQRLKRHGITICDIDTFGIFLVDAGRLLPGKPAVPRLQELLARNASGHMDQCLAFRCYSCAHCQGGVYVVIYLAYSFSSLGIRTCFRCCSECGKLEVLPDDRVPSRFVGVENILEWLDAQDQSEAARDKAERLKRLRDEHEQLRTKLAANELATMRLDYELNPCTERDAYRDRHLLPDAVVPEDKPPQTPK